MDKELQDNLKLVAEYLKIPKCDCGDPACRNYDFGGFVFFLPSEMKYHTSWDWQIPVWAKLRESPELNWHDQSEYTTAIDNDKPEEGFSIICDILKRIKA